MHFDRISNQIAVVWVPLGVHRRRLRVGLDPLGVVWNPLGVVWGPLGSLGNRLGSLGGSFGF